MNNQDIVIDVREPREFDADHVEGSLNIPLSNFTTAAPNLLRMIPGQNIQLMCQSGNRAQQALNIAQQLQFHNHEQLEVYPGGILQWKKSGNDTVSNCYCATAMPLPRQVQLVIGSMIVVFGALGYFFNPGFSILAAGTGFGLVVAGFTGYCMLANTMARLPWNRRAVAS